MPCHVPGRCQAGACLPGGVLPDGTSCADADPCNGREVCAAGVCRAGAGPAPLAIGSLRMRSTPQGEDVVLSGGISPAAPLTAASARPVGLEIRDADAVLLAARVDVPAWRQPRRGLLTHRSGGDSISLHSVGGGVHVAVHTRAALLGALRPPAGVRLVIGDECFAADLAGRCSATSRRMRCPR